MKQQTLPLSYRMSVASRIIAAVVGGYALSTITTFIFAYILPGGRAQGLLMGMMISFAIYTAVIIWVFATRSAVRAWVGLVLMALPLGLVYGYVSYGG